MKRTIRAVATALGLAAALTGCGADATDTTPPPAAAAAPARADTIERGDPVPLPDGDAVLRIRGVAKGNDGGSTVMDLETLDRLPRVEVRIDEPFEKREMTFTGVRMSDLLAIAGVGDGAREILVHALDDYRVEFPLTDVVDTGAVLATRADGRRIALADGGPIRVVFPSSDGPGRNKDNWIWSVDWIKVTA